MEALWQHLDYEMMLEALLLCAIVGVGLYATYTDVHFREISNRGTWGLLAVGLVGQAGLLMLGRTGLLQIGSVVVAGFVVGYILYAYGFWAPGDAKLFWAMAVALPPTLFGGAWSAPSYPAGLYWREVFFSFEAPLWAVVFHALVFNLLFLLLGLLYQRIANRAAERPGLVDDAPAVKAGVRTWAWAAVDLAGVSGAVVGLGPVIAGRPLTFTEAAVTALVAYLVVERAVERRYRIAVVVPGVILGVHASLLPETAKVYGSLWVIAWAISCVYLGLRRRGARLFAQALPVEVLQPGMVPGVAICTDGSGRVAYVRQEPAGREGEEMVCRPGRPLNQRTIRRLRQLAGEGSLKGLGNGLSVELPLPFAPALLAGVCATVVLSGSLIAPATALLRRWAYILSQ